MLNRNGYKPAAHCKWAAGFLYLAISINELFIVRKNTPFPFICIMFDKVAVHNECLKLLQKKVTQLQAALKDLTDIAANETKSSAGDKHETALAMIQIEQEKTSRQLQATLQQIALTQAIDSSKTHIVSGPGSLVNTDKAVFYICIPLGRLFIQAAKPVFVVSPQSPIGLALNGLKNGETCSVNGVDYVILSVA